MAFGFVHEGVILLDAANAGEDAVLEVALEAGAKDVVGDEEYVQVTTEPADFMNVKEAISEAGFEIESAELTRPDAVARCARGAPPLFLVCTPQSHTGRRRVDWDFHFAVT